MLDRLYASPTTGWVLVAIYLLLIFCAPWIPGSIRYYRAEEAYNAAHSAEPPQRILPIPESFVRANATQATEQEIEKCSGYGVCRVGLVTLDRLVDRASDDPVAFFNLILAFSTIGLWVQTKRLAVQADGQMAVARDDFVSTHRPWVSFGATIAPTGLVFSQAGLAFTLKYRCYNSGTSPAIGVSINSRAYLYVPVPSDLETQKTICAQLHAPSTHALARGTAIFPGQEEIFDIPYQIPQQGLAALACTRF